MELLSESTVGLLSDYCRTTVGLSDYRTTVGLLSDYCRTVGLLSDCRNTVGYCRTNLSDCRTGALPLGRCSVL